MQVFEDEKTDRFGNYPAVRIKGKDANPQKIHEELWNRYGGHAKAGGGIFRNPAAGR